MKFLSIFYCIADVAKCWSIFSRGKNSFQKCSFSNNILFLRSKLLFRIGSSFEKTFNIMIQVRECKCFYDNKHVSFFKKKSLEWRGSNLRCKPTIILYTLRDKVLNSIELRTKKTSNLFKNSNVIKQFFFIFLYIKLIF